ncbi:MAG: DNA-3-methyladenine glycosylase [Chloroflexi bacterium]|nr:MAG: DNA-3-methyladenine glycosylase [Chloroflexota bacterium]TMC56303.1 MAG: DNA-3-methyladenine glycosylase [Chloroflexota bacterium]
MPRSFYARSTITVARDLLGRVLVYDGPHGRRAARLVEVEAYLGELDPASHAHRGPTPRTTVMFGRPGVAYVYFIYGNHHCMNVVAHLPGVAGAVLLRGAEPLGGVGAGEARADDSRGLAGPGRLARWFGLTIAHTGWDLVRSQLHLREGAPVASRDVVRSARVGITQSLTSEEPWRFAVRGSRGVTR